jgi:hypothetical protein
MASGGCKSPEKSQILDAQARDVIRCLIARAGVEEKPHMFGWFRPTCPCDPAAKDWVEDRLRWLTKEFGLHILLERPIILPTPEFFPDPYNTSPDSVRALFDRVCGYMGIDSDHLEIRVFTDPSAGGTFAAGTWEEGGRSKHANEISVGPRGRWTNGLIRLERSTLDRPSDLIGTMAHELAHQLLLGQGRADAEASDNELITDLTAVFHGFGIFLFNNPRKSTGELTNWPGTTLRKPEYISEPLLGYALAHIAWLRDESRPVWAKHLGWAPRGVFHQGLRYLQQTRDSKFQPVRLQSGPDD